MRDKQEILQMSDLPVIPTTIGDMSFNRTGLWRYLKPVIQDNPAPCQQACPVGMPSPDFINQLIKQDPAKALDLILELNPLPGITGRLCYHPCQTKCLRRGFDQAIQIQKLERFLADTAPEPQPRTAGADKGRVAVLGAGPLGLSAAYFLARAGLGVKLFDPLDQPGGFLSQVDLAKLPAQTLARETSRLIRLAGLHLVMGENFSALDSGHPGTFNLVIQDKTSHPQGSAPASKLSRLAEQLKQEQAMLDTDDLNPAGAYKASQVAVAVAAGRDLAIRAMEALGLEREEAKLKAVSPSNKAAEAVRSEDIRYQFFASQKSALEGKNGQAITASQALAEAERCFSCGHCNLCGRCLVFCPDVSLSVNEAKQKPQVDLYHCKGCGICGHECPRRAIVMEK